jgi:hypothetical protein
MHIAAVYFAGTVGGAQCGFSPTGGEVIPDITECNAALDSLSIPAPAFPATHINSATVPRGCYYNELYGLAGFNSHPTGAVHPDIQSICKNPGRISSSTPRYSPFSLSISFLCSQQPAINPD